MNNLRTTTTTAKATVWTLTPCKHTHPRGDPGTPTPAEKNQRRSLGPQRAYSHSGHHRPVPGTKEHTAFLQPGRRRLGDTRGDRTRNFAFEAIAAHPFTAIRWTLT